MGRDGGDGGDGDWERYVYTGGDMELGREMEIGKGHGEEIVREMEKGH